MNIMIFNGLLFMLFMWTSAELESKKEPTGELQAQDSENIEERVLGGLFSNMPNQTCRDINGRCVDRRRECPKSLPLSKPPGRPWCSSKRQHCCYPDDSTEPICGVGNDGRCFGEGQLCVKPLKAKCPKGHYCCEEVEDDSTKPICGEGNDGRCFSEGHLCVKPLKAKCPKGHYCCEEVEDDTTEPICGKGKYPDATCKPDIGLCVRPVKAKCNKGYYCCNEKDDAKAICGVGKYSNGTCVIPFGPLCRPILPAACQSGYYCCGDFKECEPKQCTWSAFHGKPLQTGICSGGPILGYTNVGQQQCGDYCSCYIYHPRLCMPGRNNAMIPYKVAP